MAPSAARLPLRSAQALHTSVFNCNGTQLERHHLHELIGAFSTTSRLTLSQWLRVAWTRHMWVCEGRYPLPHYALSGEMSSFASLEAYEPVDGVDVHCHHLHLCAVHEAPPSMLEDPHPLRRHDTHEQTLTQRRWETHTSSFRGEWSCFAAAGGTPKHDRAVSRTPSS
jgi:hypothetical protein